MSLLRIVNGKIYDPANGVDGDVRDLWIENGRVRTAPTDPQAKPDRTVDATGMVVMPGGIDMHCHIAGPKVNSARKMRPEEKARLRAGPPHAAYPLRHDRQCPEHVRHRLPVRRAGIYDRFRCGRPPADRAAYTRRAARHTHHRQGLLRPRRQQPLRDAAGRRRGAGAAEGLSGLAAERDCRLRHQTGESRRR